jgi:hypothetical protein
MVMRNRAGVAAVQLSDLINVKDWGAVDLWSRRSVTDNSAAIEAAIDYAIKFQARQIIPLCIRQSYIFPGHLFDWYATTAVIRSYTPHTCWGFYSANCRR